MHKTLTTQQNEVARWKLCEKTVAMTSSLLLEPLEWFDAHSSQLRPHNESDCCKSAQIRSRFPHHARSLLSTVPERVQNRLDTSRMSHNMSRFESNGSACVILAQRDSLIASNSDISPVMNKSLDSVLIKDNRKELSVEILAIHSGYEPYHRLGNNVDKLPALVEAADRSSAERQALGSVVCSILMDYNSDIAAQLPKVLTKLVGVACRIAVKDDVGSVEYGLQILKALVEYKSRPLMLPHARQVRQTCLQLFAQRSGWNEQSVALIAEVYALYASMESAEAWSAIWVDAMRECASLVGTLGIGANSSGNANNKKGGKKAAQTDNAAQQHGGAAALTLLAESNVHTLRGVAKALRVQGLFQCVAALLVQLLSVGCSSGYVGLNVTHLLPLLQLLLSANADVSVKDPVVRAPLTMLIAFVQETWWWDVIAMWDLQGWSTFVLLQRYAGTSTL
jgi:hypothetical protein